MASRACKARGQGRRARHYARKRKGMRAAVRALAEGDSEAGQERYPDREFLVGGWPGGEQGVRAFAVGEEEADKLLNERKKEEALEKGKAGQPESAEDSDLSGPGGALGSGWPGGEKGVSLFADRGILAGNTPPTGLDIALVTAAIGTITAYASVVALTGETDLVALVARISASAQSASASVQSASASLPQPLAIGAGVALGGALVKRLADEIGRRLRRAFAWALRTLLLALVGSLLASRILGLI